MNRVLKILMVVLILAALLLLGISVPLRNSSEAAMTPLFDGGKIQLAGTEYPSSAESVTAQISRWDLEQLNRFPYLREADLRGSACYMEIAAWAQQHPNVRVNYSVPLPNGTSVDSLSENLDLSWVSVSQLPDVLAALRYVTALKSVELGDVDGTRLELKDLRAIQDVLPEVELRFAAVVGGQRIGPEDEYVNLTRLRHEDAGAIASLLARMPRLREVELGSQWESELSWEDISMLKAARQDVPFRYRFELYGQELDLDAEHLDFRGTPVQDEGAALYPVLHCMNGCKTLDMDSTGVSSEALATIRDLFPQTKVVWRVWFGQNYSVRTDTERILASKPTVGGMIVDSTPLMYCTDVKYLDLGHNEEMTDLSFAMYMPKLEVLIIAMTGVTDISPLRDCANLEYVEFNSTEIGDLSPLEGHTALHHLNIACCPNIHDISPLYGSYDLERLWIGNQTPVPASQVEEMRSIVPYCKIDTSTTDPHGNAWRFTGYDPEIPKYYWVPRYELLRNQLGYNYQEYSFYWLDPLCELEAPAEYKGKYGKGVYGL